MAFVAVNEPSSIRCTYANIQGAFVLVNGHPVMRQCRPQASTHKVLETPLLLGGVGRCARNLFLTLPRYDRGCIFCCTGLSYCTQQNQRPNRCTRDTLPLPPFITQMPTSFFGRISPLFKARSPPRDVCPRVCSGPKIGMHGFGGGAGGGRGCVRGGQDGGVGARTGRHFLVCFCFVFFRSRLSSRRGCFYYDI